MATDTTEDLTWVIAASLTDNRAPDTIRQVLEKQLEFNEEDEEEEDESGPSSPDTTNKEDDNEQENGVRTPLYKSHSCITYSNTYGLGRSISTTKHVFSNITVGASEDVSCDDEVFSIECNSASSDTSPDENNALHTDTKRRNFSYLAAVGLEDIDDENIVIVSSNSSAHKSEQEDIIQSILLDTSPDHDNNAPCATAMEHVFKRNMSYVTAMGFEDINDENTTSSDFTDHISTQQVLSQKNRLRLKHQVSIRCYEEECCEESGSSSYINHTKRKNRDDNTNENEEECETEKAMYMKKVSLVTITCYHETGDENTNDGKEKKQKKHSCKKCKVHCFDTELKVCHSNEEIAKYCLSLPSCKFVGQTTTANDPDGFDKDLIGTIHLGAHLQHMDSFLRKFDTAEGFTGTDEYYLQLLRKIATERCMPDETVDKCYERLLKDSGKFVEIYRQRGEHSQPIESNFDYWGTRQQLLGGKVIADWIDKANGSLDPIFGVLLQPTVGRAGPGDNCWLHNLIFDAHGQFAYHSAVHDAFGYLKSKHDVGPGYDYMGHSILKASSPLAGQIDGIRFWKKALKRIQLKPNIYDLTCRVLSNLERWHPENT